MTSALLQGSNVPIVAKGGLESNNLSLVPSLFSGCRVGNTYGVQRDLKLGQSLSRGYRKFGPMAMGRELSELEKVRGEERRRIDKSEILLEDPYGPVEGAMSTPVVTVGMEDTLDSVTPLFEHYTGIPVVDENQKCVGIISNIDVARYARGKALSLPTTRVRQVMTSPAFVILMHAPIAYAAGLMLQHKVHRLPVVGANNVVVGIITRTDIFEPLMPKNLSPLHKSVGDNNRRSFD